MAQPQTPQTEAHKPHDPDQIVHTPTRHTVRWLMGILLLIMILTTFTVGDEIRRLLTGEGRSSDFATWVRPGVGKQSISFQDWQTWARALNKVHSMVGRPLPESQLKSEVALTIVLGALAEDAGVTVSDKELGEQILLRFGSASVYHQSLQQVQLTPKEFEATLRQSLAVARYTTLLAGAWNTPDLDEIEKAWKRQHQEYAFDYVQLPVEQMLESVKATPLTDEEQHAYFDALPQARKDTFKSKEKISADVVSLAYADAASEKLLAKFPKPADEAEAEKQAKAYYDGFGAQRFAGKPYEEVKDAARSEAQAYAALQAWLADMRSRVDKGLAVNFAGDSASLGLALHHMPAALEQADWIAAKPEQWLGAKSAALVFGNATDVVVGKLYPSVVLAENGFVILQVVEKQEPVLQPFDQIAPALRDEIWQKKAKEAAVAKLEALRDQLGTRPPAPAPGDPPAPPFAPEVEESKFYEVARGAGLEAQLRDYKDRLLPPGTGTPAPVDLWARMQSAIYSSKPGSVPAASGDIEGKYAYLVRVREPRDPDPKKMKANDFLSTSDTLKQRAEGEFQQKAFTLQALQTRLGLVFNEKLAGGGQ